MDTLEILDRLDTLDAIDDNENDLAGDSDRHKQLLTSLGVEDVDAADASKKSIRSEATNDVSVFSLNPGSKINVTDLVNSINDTINVNILKKDLSKIENPSNRLSALLPKITADRAERDAAYEESSEKISKWDDVVKRNRRTEHLSFPLKHESMQIHTVDEFVQKFKPKTPLEQQIYALLKGNKYQENPETGLSQAEEEALKSVSLEEAKRRRAELQKHRALLSYHEAKNRRQSKIKSRRHLRTLRKQKEKKSDAEFEKLQATDPEKAAEQLKLAQKTRAEERAVLRHRQGSKWAKNRMLIARYNEMTKVQLNEQKKLHGELVQRNVDKLESSDDENEAAEDSAEDTVANPLVPSTASLPAICLPKNNPWLRRTAETAESRSQEAAVDDTQRASKRTGDGVLGLREVTKVKEGSDDSDEEGEMASELAELRDRKRLREMMENEEQVEEDDIQNFRDALAQLTRESGKAKKEDNCEIAQEDECPVAEDGLELGLERRRSLRDLENVLASDDRVESLSELHSASATNSKPEKEPENLEQIDPDKVFTLETSELRTESRDFENEMETDDANRMTIQEAFADDDVLADFVAEKRKLVDDSKPEVRDLTLPGWGDWGGTGIKVSKRKRKRFAVKPTPRPPRKDSHLGAVIINENRDANIAKHQVRQLPYGFTSFEQYERSIRQPIGKTWNTPATFKTLTKPKVSTVLGAIIDPMDESDAFDNTKTHSRKRTAGKGGQVRFDDEPAPDKVYFKRKKGNKKHKK